MLFKKKNQADEIDSQIEKNKLIQDINQKSTGQSKKEVAWLYIKEFLKIIIISLVIIIPVRYFLIQPFYVKGASMEPNFYDHEYLIINEIVYRFNEPQRGDVVVFHYPYEPSDYFIKRMIGLPGEHIEIEDGKIYISNPELNMENYQLQEDYLSAEMKTLGNFSFDLSSEEYLVLGDNRVQSLDSRSFGPITEEHIIGKAWVRGWPINRATVFKAPEYNF